MGKLGQVRRKRYPVLIETLWNVNQTDRQKKETVLSINRNIVECKYTSVWHVSGNAVVLIETLWNVNYYHPFADPHCIIVLIETLWNVNLEPITFPVLSLFVLIETLWNVNLNRRYGISKHALY